MESCDVLIVGAGPAGSTCARLLSGSGLSVLLLDRDEFPRDKPCAGWITPAVLQALELDPHHYRKERLLQEIREFRTGLMGRREIVTDYGRTVSYAVLRSEFDHYLLIRSGCRSLLGEPVVTLEREPESWVVNGWIRARLLVGAGGHLCPVARALGGRPEGPAIAAMVAEFEMGEDEVSRSPIPAGSVSLSFTPDMNGYGWALRKGRVLNVGLGSLDGSEVRRHVLQYCEHLRMTGVLKEDISGRLKGHCYLPYRYPGGRRIVTERGLLIGDAAGVSSPESGEGILPAVETAIMAAHTILAAGGDFRMETMAPYAEAVAQRFGKGAMDLRLPPALKKKLGAMILSNRFLTRRLVLDRWFLHARDVEGGETPVELAASVSEE